MCFAEADNLVWELISPLEGPNIFQKFLDEHGTCTSTLLCCCAASRYDVPPVGEGIHHTAWDCNNVPFEVCSPPPRATGALPDGLALTGAHCGVPAARLCAGTGGQLDGQEPLCLL